MRQTTDYSVLFTPFELAGKRLRNRIAHASMTTLSTPAGRVTERLIQYHANRAAGGAALTVTEPLGIKRHQAGLDLSPNFPPLKSRVLGCRHTHRDGVSLFGLT